ncbi:toll/interleukin-1 receptor domain-containing protein [Candidatus Thiodictyon syntrophicum]|jgi:hypothetical protein|uniref:toll/interleukin-1 receptor domain-containing protein n=1 Tax=Candidatus Thiodictyon syntrophicum TaxID=1166950 RepID=UPI0012FE6AC5|nr:toll/interleukin-1 receptor domain-containing protein [Candidatus Thiodictyon syntrophicum]MBV5335845.1 toll/interleukin-1 receptor domain-containing protein [bacterium]
MIPKEVFLSHSSVDRDFAASLTAELRRHGIPVWYSETNILGAQQWHDRFSGSLRYRLPQLTAILGRWLPGG